MPKKWMALILTLLFLPVLSGDRVCADAQGEEGLPTLNVSAKAAILMDAQSGRVLFEHNADTRYPMASTTKIMTALIAVEHCGMDETVTAGKNASGVEGTSIYLSVGEQLPMEQMLQGLMLRSGNDAAVAIAEHIAGDVEQFAFLMNERARMLGADAHFVTPNGLDAQGHGASARAMALIAREAMKHPTFRELVSTQEAVIPWVDNEYNRVLRNKNRLLSEYEGATGIKTGFTSKAGRCLVFSAQRNGMELIGVVMSCPNWFDEAERMLDWGFGNFSVQAVVQAGETVGEAKLLKGMQESVRLCAGDALAYPMTEADEWQVECYIAQTLQAPVSQGDIAGYLILRVNGEEVGRVDALVEGNAPRWSVGAAVRGWFASLPFFGRN